MGPAVREDRRGRAVAASSSSSGFLYKPAIWRDEMEEVKEAFRRVERVRHSGFSTWEGHQLRSSAALSRNKLAKARTQIPSLTPHVPPSLLAHIQSNRSQPPSVLLNHVRNVLSMCKRIRYSQCSLSERKKNPYNVAFYPALLRRPADSKHVRTQKSMKKKKMMKKKKDLDPLLPYAYTPRKMMLLYDVSNGVLPPPSAPPPAFRHKKTLARLPAFKSLRTAPSLAESCPSGRDRLSSDRSYERILQDYWPMSFSARTPRASEDPHCIPSMARKGGYRPSFGEMSNRSTITAASSDTSPMLSPTGFYSSRSQEYVSTPRGRKSTMAERPPSRRGKTHSVSTAIQSLPASRTQGKPRPISAQFTDNFRKGADEECERAAKTERMMPLYARNRVTFAAERDVENATTTDSSCDDGRSHMSENKLEQVREGVIVKHSADPYLDFKNSMMKMIVTENLDKGDEKQLEKLFQLYLLLNPKSHHPVIHCVIADIKNDLRKQKKNRHLFSS